MGFSVFRSKLKASRSFQKKCLKIILKKDILASCCCTVFVIKCCNILAFFETLTVSSVEPMKLETMFIIDETYDKRRGMQGHKKPAGSLLYARRSKSSVSMTQPSEIPQIIFRNRPLRRCEGFSIREYSVLKLCYLVQAKISVKVFVSGEHVPPIKISSHGAKKAPRAV